MSLRGGDRAVQRYSWGVRYMAHGGSVISREAVRLKASDGDWFFFSSEAVDIIMTICIKVMPLVQFNGAWQEGLETLNVLERQRRAGAGAAACGTQAGAAQWEGCAQDSTA